MPEDIPDKIAEDMSDKMSENRSDRMSENLSIIKCIDIMVGIIRNKII
jgi:hypothetical protein